MTREEMHAWHFSLGGSSARRDRTLVPLRDHPSRRRQRTSANACRAPRGEVCSSRVWATFSKRAPSASARSSGEWRRTGSPLQRSARHSSASTRWSEGSARHDPSAGGVALSDGRVPPATGAPRPASPRVEVWHMSRSPERQPTRRYHAEREPSDQRSAPPSRSCARPAVIRSRLRCVPSCRRGWRAGAHLRPG